MELVNIFYKYVNRFINSEELIIFLENLNRDNFKTKELIDIDETIKKIKKIINDTPNEIDEVELKRRDKIDGILNALYLALKNSNNDPSIVEYLTKKIEELKKDKERQKDSQKRYSEIINIIINNKTYITYHNKMDALTLLNFITQYIYAPVPPKISQDVFNDLVETGIKENMKEAIWRLAVNFNDYHMDLTIIEDYFINIKDDYYLLELITAAEESIDIANIVKKVLATKDEDFIEKCGSRAIQLGVFLKEELLELKKEFEI